MRKVEFNFPRFSKIRDNDLYVDEGINRAWLTRDRGESLEAFRNRVVNIQLEIFSVDDVHEAEIGETNEQFLERVCK